MMFLPSTPLLCTKGLHAERWAALGSRQVARAQINSSCLLIHEDRAQHVREVPKRKGGGQERKGSHVASRGSYFTFKQRHRKQEPVSHKHFIAVNKRILSSSSITDLARLVSQEKKLNEVNVCSATTQLHRLLRQLHDTKDTTHHHRSTKQTAFSAAAAGAGELAAACQMLPTLVNATLSVDGLSPDHCVRILTAHAWMKQILPPQAWQLQQQSCSWLDSSSTSNSREAWHRMLHRLCSTLAAASTTTPPEHLSRGLWACARLGHVHAGLVAAASARMLHLVQESHRTMPQEQQQQQHHHHHHPAEDSVDAVHQQARVHKGSDSGSREEGSTRHALPASAEAPRSSTVSPPSSMSPHAHHQQALPAPQHTCTNTSSPSLPDTLSNLVWALGQLLQPLSTHQPDAPAPPPHAPHSSMPNTAAAVATMDPGLKAACTPEAVKLVSAVQQRLAAQPEWLARWGPQRMATLMHGLTNLQLARMRALNTASPAGHHLRALLSEEHSMHRAGAGERVPRLNTAVAPAVPPTSPSLLLALCQSVHHLLAGRSPPSQSNTQQADVPRAAHASPQALSNMAWCLATLWSLADQQPAFDEGLPCGSIDVDADIGGRDANPEAGSSGMASSTYGSSTNATQSISSSALPGPPSEQEPHELHAECTRAVRALAHAALGHQGDGLSRFLPQELCSLLHAVADLHAMPPPDPLNLSVSRSTPVAVPDHSGMSTQHAASCEGAGSSSSSSSSSMGSDSNIPAGALNSLHPSTYASASPSGTSTPHRPHPPPQPSQPTQARGKPATEPHPAPPLPSPLAHTHSQRSPAVANLLHRVFAAALDSAAARVAAFSVMDCCEVLHACATVGLSSAHPDALPTAPFDEGAPQQQAHHLRFCLQALCERIEAQPQELPPSRVPMLLWSMARLGLLPVRLLACLRAPPEASAPRSPTAAPTSGPTIIQDSLSPESGPPPATSSDSEEPSRSSSDRAMDEVAQGGFGAERTVAMPGCDDGEGSALAGLSPDRLAKVAWALATMAQSIHANTQQQHLQQGQDCDPHALVVSLLLRLEPDAVQQVEAMDNQSLCMVLWAFASNRCHCPRLLAATAPELLRRCTISTGRAAPSSPSSPVPHPSADIARDMSPPSAAASASAAPAALPVSGAPAPAAPAAASASEAVGKVARMPAIRSMSALHQPFAVPDTHAPALAGPLSHVADTAAAPAAAPAAAAAAAAAAPQAPSASKLATEDAAPTALLPVPASSAEAAAVLHPRPSAPPSVPSAPNSLPLPAEALPRTHAHYFSPLLGSQAAFGTESHSSSSSANTTTTTSAAASRKVRFGKSKLRRKFCLRRPGPPAHVGLRLKLQSRLGTASPRALHASPPTGSNTTSMSRSNNSSVASSSSRTSSRSDMNPGTHDSTGELAASVSTLGVDGFGGGDTGTDYTTTGSSIDAASLSSSIHTSRNNIHTSSSSIHTSSHTSSSISHTSNVGGQHAAAPQPLSCQQLAMALWAVARLLEAGHNQLGVSMAPLRLF
ncbi:hypothetical protein DUNSADRAFT_9953, partial [Dunaliella salina]